MRYKVVVEAKTNEIPIEYRRGVMSLFKTMLGDISNGMYMDKYYPDIRKTTDEGVAQLKPNPFTFSVKLYKPKFTSESVVLEKKEFEIIFSTDDQMTALIFHNGFLGKKDKWMKFGNTEIKINKIYDYKEQVIEVNGINIKMLSPLCIREHNKENNKDYYYSSMREKFKVQAEEVISTQLEARGFSKKDREVKIDCIREVKTVVTHYGQKIEVSLGEFRLEGNKKALTSLYLSGIGSRSSAGFGLFDLL